MKTAPPERLRRWLDNYKATAVILCNTGLLFLALNLLFLLFGWLTAEPPGQRLVNKYGLEKLRAAHPKLTDAEILQLQEETWGRHLAYEPFTEFKEGKFSGKHLNVSPAGFRFGAEAGPWPPDPQRMNLFVFGGSTTFGYGVADGETLPAQLQVQLRRLAPAKQVSVYNYGRGFFASTQERILFQQLLLQGRRPAIAVFVDGVNDAVFPADESALSADLDAAVRRKNGQAHDLGLLGQFPLLRPVERLLVGDATPAREQALWRMVNPSGQPPSLEQMTQWVGTRFLTNARLSAATGRELGVRTLFVWQPCPFYHSDPTRFPFKFNAGDQFVRATYEHMTRRDRKELPEHFLWLADGQDTLPGPLYVDAAHYSSAFNAVLAGRIADWMKSNGWLD
ncbi:MAG: hypothetical protein RL514_4672 [Verrucomicrobiota bacterium]|jgi:hypothetical protein